MTSSVMHPTIQTASGHYINLLEPDKGYYTPFDIAHALGNLCRFNGHCREFYSVAEHCVHVSMMVPPELAMDALMHDAAEAYLGDITSPLKALLPEYKRIEFRVEAALRRALGLGALLDPRIKKADLRMLATEQQQLMPDLTTPWEITKGIKPYDIQLARWSPSVAQRYFIDRYMELNGARAIQQRQGTMQP